MTDEQRGALVEAGKEALWDVWDCEEDNDERLAIYVRAILAAIEPAIRANERAQVVGEAAARTTAPHGVCYATVRVAEDKHGFEELHIECRMQDGQKGAFVRVYVEFDDLAHWIADALSKPPVDPAAIRANERARVGAEVERLRAALQDIANSDDIENALDPERNKRVARTALATEDKP